METKESLSHSRPTGSHIEETDIAAQAGEIISYDDNGPAGIIRSPYVLGAAALASFGGFSFGYGTFLPPSETHHKTC